MLKQVALTIILLVYSACGQAQSVFLNFDVDTTIWDISEPLNLWVDFLNTKNDSAGSVYWNVEEVEAYDSANYFLLKKELSFGMPDFLAFISYANIRILSIRKRGDFHKINSSLSFVNENGGEDLYAIFDVYVGDEEGDLKLYNPLYISKKFTLERKKVGFLTYYFPKNHVFDMEKAIRQNEFLVDLAARFNVPLVEVEYYFAETDEEIQIIKGFTYLFGDNGESLPSGISYINERMVFTNGSGEYYPHEIIHVLLNPHFPNAHYWINEGIATYFGMSRGKNLDWHLEKLNNHLNTHPEIDLADMLTLQNVDGSTAYQYVLGGFIVQLIFEEKGYDGLKRALEGGTTADDFYALISKQLKIKRKDINAVFREKISMYLESK